MLGRHAFALGLIWDHLLDTAGSYPWMETLRGQAAEATARAEEARRRKAERDAEQGGCSAVGRVRGLFSQARSLARIDRPLLDRIDALPPPASVRQPAGRPAARCGWPGWNGSAGSPTRSPPPRPTAHCPDPFTEQNGAAAFNRLLSDPEVPHTTITLHLAARTSGTRHVTEVLQQAAAFPALIALANDDPLVAAIDAVYNAAIAHGDDRDRFLTEAHTALP